MHNLITFIAKYFVAIPVLGWLLVLLRLNMKDRLRLVIFTAISAVLTIILVKIATTIHQDPRPFIRDHVHPYFTSSTDNGFPSDHTAFSVLLGLVVLRYNRRLGIGLVIIAFLIGLARVISGVHHGQDIIGGFAIALISVSLVWLLEHAVAYVRSSHEKVDV